MGVSLADAPGRRGRGTVQYNAATRDAATGAVGGTATSGINHAGRV
jgi:hypothetical protein